MAGDFDNYPGVDLEDDEDERLRGGKGASGAYPPVGPTPQPSGTNMQPTLGGDNLSGFEDAPPPSPAPGGEPSFGIQPGPSRSVAMEGTVGHRPQESDYPAATPQGWKGRLAPLMVGMAAMSPNDPQAGQRTYNELYVAPKERATGQFNKATEEYERRVADEQREEDLSRQSRAEASTEGLQGAEADRNRAAADKDRKESKSQAAATVTVGDGKGGSMVKQWNDKTQRYDIDVAPGAMPTGANEEERYFQQGVKDGKWNNDSDGRKKATIEYSANKRDPQVDLDRQAGMDERAYEHWSKRLDDTAKPYRDRQERLGRLHQTLDMNSPAADALVAPEILSAMAGGQGSGIRMSEQEIMRIVGGRNAWQDLKSKLLRYQADPTKPFLITPEQRKQTRDLINAIELRNSQRLKVVQEAGDNMLEASHKGDTRAYRDVYSHAIQELDRADSTMATEKWEAKPEWALPDPAKGLKGGPLPEGTYWKKNGQRVAMIRNGKWGDPNGL